ncbi:hypothetical protein D3C71_1678200 [compost metagenome]
MTFLTADIHHAAVRFIVVVVGERAKVCRELDIERDRRWAQVARAPLGILLNAQHRDPQIAVIIVTLIEDVDGCHFLHTNFLRDTELHFVVGKSRLVLAEPGVFFRKMRIAECYTGFFDGGDARDQCRRVAHVRLPYLYA